LGTPLERESDYRFNLKIERKHMNTQHVSFQSLRLLCSRAKARLFPAALLCCLLGSAGLAQELPDALNQTGLPFKGSLVADENYREYTSASPSGEILSPITRLLFVVTADGTATTARFGPMRVIYVGMVDYLGGTGQQCARFIAANGDSIFTTATGQASQTQNPGVRSILELHTVVGGTGDFARVSGKLTVSRSLKIAADGLTGHSEGTVNGFLTFTY
jgi:hypothetical protein